MPDAGNNRIASLAEKIISFFIYTNIFLAVSVTSLVFETYIILAGGIPGLSYPFFLFCSTLTLYCFHRVYRFDFRAGEEKLAERHRWTRRHRIVFFLVFIFAAVGVICSLLFFVNLRTVLYLLPVGFISFGYTVPCIPARRGWVRLRDLPGIKIFLISLVLGLTTVLLPLLEYNKLHELMRPEILFVFIRRMLFIFAITVPFDIRDMDYDRENGTRTLPVVYGIHTSKYSALAALVIFVMLGLLQYFTVPGTNLGYVIALVMSGIVSAVMVVITHRGRPELFYSVYVEGMMLLQCLLVMAAYRFLP